MATKRARNVTSPSRKIQDSVKRVTASKTSASAFLKSAGIMTQQGNLSPKYK